MYHSGRCRDISLCLLGLNALDWFAFVRINGAHGQKVWKLGFEIQKTDNIDFSYHKISILDTATGWFRLVADLQFLCVISLLTMYHIG